jgi:hypothetical protein
MENPRGIGDRIRVRKEQRAMFSKWSLMNYTNLFSIKQKPGGKGDPGRSPLYLAVL